MRVCVHTIKNTYSEDHAAPMHNNTKQTAFIHTHKHMPITLNTREASDSIQRAFPRIFLNAHIKSLITECKIIMRRLRPVVDIAN